MSRHRNVRSLKYEEEYDGYDDVYGHSVEDDYCISPGTAAQFTINRNDIQHPLGSYVPQSIAEEEELEESEGEESAAQQSSSSASALRRGLNASETTQLNACLETMRSILGDSCTEASMIDTVLSTNYNTEQALNILLSQQDAPKPQRTPRKRPDRGSSNIAPDSQYLDIRQADKALPTADISLAAPIEIKKTPSNSRLHHTDNTTTKPVQLENISDTGKKSTAKFSIGPCSTTQASSSSEQVLGGGTSNGACGDANNGDVKSDTRYSEHLHEFMDIGGSAEVIERSTATPKREIPDLNSLAVTPALHKSSSKAKMDRLDVQKEFERRKADGKDFINLVVIGHVDAGKSTLMGHVLFRLGFVNKRVMHKYEQESKKIGKASFAFAWVLDETEEERSRGVTMDIAQTRFETKTKVVTLLDAPGHKDFIPNMITGASQADVAMLVINATKGEFETGFEMGGQTREHAMLVRSLGVSQLLVTINKMDTVEWSQDRYDEIVKKLGQFLKQVGFREADLSYVPCSGLSGDNLTEPATEPKLTTWYTGPCLVDQIDQFRPPERPVVDKPLRMCVSDVFKSTGAGFSVAGTVQTGSLQAGDRVLAIPAGEIGLIKAVTVDDSPISVGFAGDNVIVSLTGIDITNISIGSILCDPLNPVETTTRLRARIVIFNISLPITTGYPVILHYQSLTEQAYIVRLVSQLHRNTGEIIKKRPRCLVKNTSAVVDIEVSRPICVELYKNNKDLGRFMLRASGSTIAAGMIIEILSKKSVDTARGEFYLACD